jgi:polyisoprenoid-binding protein YceI
VPAGSYALDKAHASLIFRVNHLGFSHWTARFTRFDAKLQFDPANPATAQVTVTIDPASITPDNPPPGFVASLRGAQWLSAAQFPKITYRSTRVERVGQNAMRIFGELTLHGKTQPVVLDATYNGGYIGHPMDPHARIGFSAHGTLKRSDFGIAFGIPQPGSTMGVSDAVEFSIEAEFSGPAWAGAGNTPAEKS